MGKRLERVGEIYTTVTLLNSTPESEIDIDEVRRNLRVSSFILNAITSDPAKMVIRTLTFDGGRLTNIRYWDAAEFKAPTTHINPAS